MRTDRGQRDDTVDRVRLRILVDIRLRQSNQHDLAEPRFRPLHAGRLILGDADHRFAAERDEVDRQGLALGIPLRHDETVAFLGKLVFRPGEGRPDNAATGHAEYGCAAVDDELVSFRRSHGAPFLH